MYMKVVNAEDTFCYGIRIPMKNIIAAEYTVPQTKPSMGDHYAKLATTVYPCFDAYLK